MDRELERLFLRYRTDGDSGALADVFDRAAPEILKVAIHLTKDPVEAEDLLQQTFIVAIEKAAAFDARKRLVPWMLGILANLAKRRGRRPPDPDRLRPRPEPPDPADAAQRKEATDELGKAVEKLPEPYRAVLRLRLRDVEPAAIAHELGRAPGTVRSQIHRGLELLRRALPAGLSLGALGTLAATRGLAAVRAEVTKAAVAASPTHVALAGVAMSKKTLAIAAGLVLALAGGYVGVRAWPDRSAPERTNEAREDLPDPREEAEDAPSLVERADTATPPERALVPPEVKRVSGYGSVDVKVHWRVANREPSVRGTRVHLAVGTLHHEVRETDSTGVARFPRVPAGLAAATVPGAYGGGGSAHVEAGRHAEITLYMTPRGEVLEAVEGEVVDAEDAPVPGAWILAPTFGPAMVLAVTDDRGRFRIAPLQKDTVLQARAAGFAPSREVAAEGGRVRLVLASGGGALVGRVVDATKRPVAGARVRLERKTRVRPQTSTNEGGVFFLEGIAPGPLPLYVRRRGHVAWAGEVEVLENELTSVEIALGRGGAVFGSVRDARDRPVPSVRITSTAGRTIAYPDKEGRYRLEDLPPGEVQVTAHRSRGTPRKATVEVVAGGETRHDFRFEAAPETITGRLVDAAGEPAAGWRLVLVANAFRLDRVVTGEDGAFAFTRKTKPEHRFLVHVYDRDDAKVPVHVVRDVLGDAKDLVVRVPAGAAASSFVEGRVVAGGAALPDCQIQLVNPEDGVRAAFDLPAGQERFRIGPIPPGQYDVRLFTRREALRWEYRARTGPKTVEGGATVDVGTLALEAPGALVVRLRPKDVEAFPEVSCEVRGPDYHPAEVARREGVREGASEIRIERLPAGRYHAVLWAGGMSKVVLASISIESGTATTRDVTLKRGVACGLVFRMPRAPADARKLLVRVLASDGTAVMDGWYGRREPQVFWGGTYAAPGDYTVEAETRSGEHARGRFTLPEEGTKPGERIDVALD